ncbi:MAG: cytochrome c oxidase subunit II [Aggregatilineales bacterium]
MDFGKKSNSNSLLIPIIAGGIFIVLGGLAIGALTPSVFPDQASAESEQVDTLFRFLLVIGGAIFLLVQGLLLYSVLTFGKRDDDEEDGPTIHGNTTLELVWTAIPAVIVLILVIYSYQVWVDIREPNENETTITAVGARYAWTFGYEDAQGRTVADSQDVIRGALPDLHTYAGQHVVMSMQTQDVIHAFWIPEMRVKQDLLPGRTTEIRFTPIVPENGWDYTDEASGTQYNRYRVVCTELCGSGHGNMWANVYVHESEEAYLEILEREVFDPIINPPADPVIRGRQVIQNYPCSGCHVLSDVGWAGVTGPVLNGVGDRAATRVAGQTAEEYLYRSLHYPNEYLVPGYGALMPQFQPGDPAGANYMPTNDFYAIVSYLCTQTGSGESNCDLDNLRNVIDADNPDNPVTFGAGADATDVEATAEATAEMETTSEAEMTPEAEVTPAAEDTPEPDANIGVGS